MNYRIRLSHSNFLLHGKNFKVHNLSLEDKGISLSTDKDGIKYLKTMRIEFEQIDSPKSFLKQMAKKNKWFFLGSVLFIFILYVNANCVKEIRINGNYPINNSVETYIRRNLKHIGPLSFLDANLVVMSKNLREAYPNYEWINLTKDGNVINVSVSTSPINYYSYQEEFGDIVAKKSGIVKYYSIYEGKRVVEYNDYVRSGDLLVSGNKLYGSEKTDLSSARGIILAEVFEEQKVIVNKIKNENMRTGRIDFVEKITIFGHEFYFNQDEQFKNYDEEEKCIFNIANIFSYNYLERKEKNDIITVYDIDDAILYGKNYITNEFILNKVDEKEEIIDIVVKIKEEKNDCYEITYLIKKHESIGKFIRR